MNIQESNILNLIITNKYTNQRELSKASGHSLGIVNRSIKDLISAGYLDKNIQPTSKALSIIQESAPQRAIILAAGFGMRMVPINTETPKGLLEVHGEPLIERQIKQLHEVGIQEIYVVVGFMKEAYEYLIDDYNVKLIVNPDYATKNNLHSLYLAKEHLANAYIIPCDIWCDYNPFQKYELYSWYMVSDLVDNDSTVRVNRKFELTQISNASGGNSMVGISYLLKEDASIISKRLDHFDRDPQYHDKFWEETLYANNKMIIPAKVVHSANIVEINTFEQLRELDSLSNHLQSDILEIAANALNTKPENISDITVLKKGMTNRSFLFDCNGTKHIMRIPGEGTDQLINRREEAQVYQVIQNKGLCDDIEYINPENGYKLTRFLNHARVCDPHNSNDIAKCMKKLRQFHEMKLKVNHRFDIFKQINFYESLWSGHPSIYRDYEQTKKYVLSLRSYIDQHKSEEVLTHIDAVPDNFLFTTDSSGKEDIRLIDWEYSGMQDPHLDIAMFCIYSLYSREEVDYLISLYFPEGCTDTTRVKIYCYIAVSGLLWSNWCEYKRHLGVDFGEYSLCQYRYAKEYYRIVQHELKQINNINK